jgi:hypothetical protein
MASRMTNTMTEALQRMLQDLAQMKILQDADLPFVMSLETQIVEKLRDPVTRMQEQGLMPQGPPQQQQDPSMGGPSFLGSGGVSGGVAMGSGAPNADELQRLLSAGG